MMTKIEKWELWFQEYRGTELAELVLRLTRVAIEKGEVTAEDAHCVPVKNPNIRGAAMRRLRAFGVIRKEAPIVGTTEQSHGHVMFRWVLADAAAARHVLNGISRAALYPNTRPASEPQPEITADPHGQLLMGALA